MKKFNGKSIFLGLAAATIISSNAYAGIEGWKFEGNNWKYYKEDKALKAWQQLNNKWYFFNEDGSLKTGWHLDATNNWYFLDSSKNSNEGMLLSGWQWIDGYCYYFENIDKSTLGRMYVNTVVNGYRIDATGRWTNEKGVEYYEAGKGIITVNTLQGSLNTGKKSSGGGSSGKGGGLGKSGESGKGGSSIGGIGGKTGINQGDNNDTSNQSLIVEENSTVNNADQTKSVEKTKGDQKSEQNNSNEVNTTEGGQNKSGTINNNPSEYLYNKPTVNKENEDEKTNTTQDNKVSDSTSNDLSKTKDTQTNTNDSDIKSATASNAEIQKEEEHKNTETTNSSEKNKNTEQQNKSEENIVESDQDKAHRIKSSLTTVKNDNVVQYTNEDGEIRTIIWAKGINGPTMGEGGDFHKEITNAGSDTYIDYKTSFTTGDGWYDVNKTRAGGNVDVDKNLCFGAVSSNMLHWWFEQNIEYIDRYIVKNGDIIRANRKISDLKYSFKSQQNSAIFELFKVLFGNNEKGFYTDLLMDLFINGYTPKTGGGTNIERDDLTPDSRGGFFYDVFKGEKLTDRTYGGSYEALGDKLKEVLGEAGLIGISHKAFKNSNHIVTLWGAEYDLNGKLIAVYISDSDDQNETEDERDLGMKRYEVRNVGGVAKLSTNQTNKSSGSAIGYLHILYLGTTQWENYFK